MGSQNGISGRNEMKDVVYNLENEDLDNFVNGIAAKGNPILLAAEFGCHKILKQIVEQISFDDSNENGENILHLGELSISHDCCN